MISPELREALLKLPAQLAPKGVTANFENPSNLYELMRNILIGGVVTATFLVAIKLYTQIWIIRKVHMEDYFFVLAWAIFVFAFQPLALLLGRLPIGMHQWNTHLGPFIQHLFYWYCAFITYGFVIMFLKVVVLLQMIRVFVPAGLRNVTFWAAHFMIWTNVAFYVAFAFLEMFCCTPRAKFWDKTIQEGHCLDFLAIHVVGAVICLASDILILLLPQRVIFSLQLPLKRKLGLSLLFTVGIFACTSSAVRLYYHVVLFRARSDYTYTLGKIGVWAMLQEISGFVVAGLPVFPKVIKHLRKTPRVILLETQIKSALNISSRKITQLSEKITTIGGGRRRDAKPRMVTDAEFDELVFKTDASDTTFLTSFTKSVNVESRKGTEGEDGIEINQ